MILKQLPNMLSCCRIVLSPLLLLTANIKVAFLFIFVICGLTDIADGFIARKYNAITPIGAKLDSFADMIFSIILLCLIFPKLKLEYDILLMIIALIFCVRVANIVITKIKFKQWGVIHTIGNKAIGVALIIVVPIYILFDLLSTDFMMTLALVALLVAVEETCILISSSSYDVNRKSLLSCVDEQLFIKNTECFSSEKQ